MNALYVDSHIAGTNAQALLGTGPKYVYESQ